MIQKTLCSLSALLTFCVLPVSAAVRVVATTPDLASLAREVGGEFVTVDALAQANQDPHAVSATPSMVVRLSQADLFVLNGLDLEIGWVPALLQASRSAKIAPGAPGHVDASARVPLLDVPSGAVDRSMGDVHPFGNPHYTLDPGRARWAAWNIANGLIRVDPAHGEEYKANLKRLYERIDRVLARAREAMKTRRGARVIVYHRRYGYLLDRLGLVEVGALEPKPGIPPSASHISGLISSWKGKGVAAVVVDAWNDRRIAEQVASGVGAKVVVAVASTGAEPGCGDVIAVFERNVERILAALGAAP